MRRFEQLERRDLMAIDFNFTYLNDLPDIGFNHPEKGADRKATLEAAAEEYGSWFNHTATIDIEVGNFNTGILHAQSEPAFSDTVPPPGFERSIPEQKIILGAADPNGTDPDGFLTVNWEDDNPAAEPLVWELGDDVQAGTEADFHTLIVHELTHILGFLSVIGQFGQDANDPPTALDQPGLWNTFDQFVADPTGTSIIDNTTFALNSEKWFTESTAGSTDPADGLFFNGPNAVAANGGQLVPLQSADPFVEGRSVSHVRIIDSAFTDASFVMLQEVADGQVARRLHPLEVAMMQDLGYDMTLPAPEIEITESDDSTAVSEAGTTDTFDVSLSVRPPTDVVIEVQALDTDEVQVTSPINLTFTPVNWNVPQTVTVLGLNDTELDGVQLALLQVSVVQAVSDPLYDLALPKLVSVENTDDETPPLRRGEFSIEPLTSQDEGSGGVPTPFHFVVTRANGTDGEVSVDFAVTGTGAAPADGDDIANGFPSGTLIFLDGEGSAVVTLNVIADTDVEADEEYLVTLSNATGDATIPAGNETATGTIFDDDDDVPPPFMSPIIVGLAAGGLPEVKVFEGNGAQRSDFFAYPPNVSAGVRVAAGYVDGDGTADIITATGPGGPAHVKVFSGSNGSELASFFAFDPSFNGSVNVAAGDVNGDGTSDIITGIGAGVPSHVKVIDGTKLGQLEANGQIADSALLASFFAFDPGFLGGVSVAAGDVDDDGKADIIVGAGQGSTPHVKVIDGTQLGQVEGNGQIADSALLFSFFAYDAGFSGGVTVAAGDINGDGRAEIISGIGAGAGPHVKAFSGADSSLLLSFFAYAPTFAGGVDVAAGDVNGDGRADIITGTASGATQVKAFSGIDNSELSSFFAFTGSTAGVYVTAADSPPIRDSSTSIELTSSDTESVFGQAVTFTVNINHVAAGMPTGTVQFIIDDDNANPINVNVDNGRASLTRSDLSRALHRIEARYTGDTNFDGSPPQFLNQTVNNADTSVTLTSSKNPSLPDEEVTFTAALSAVAPGAGIPTGTVTFNVDGVDQVPVTLNATGRATLTLNGQHTITATYNGDANFNASPTSDTLSQLVDDSAPTPFIFSFEPPVTKASTIGFEVIFGEEVIGFEENDLVVANGTVSNFHFDPQFNAFVFDVTPTEDGVITVDIAANAATDLAGNQSNVATQFTVTSDRTGPKPTIVSTLGTITNQLTLPMRVTFDEVPTDFDDTDLAVVGGTVGNFQVVSDTDFTFNINVSISEGAVTVDIAAGKATDALGNSSQAAEQVSITLDQRSPSPSISSRGGNPTNQSLIIFDVSFGEDVTGFEQDDLAVTGGTVTNFSGSGRIYSFHVTPGAVDGPITVNIATNAATDLAGNQSLAALQRTITSDRTAPKPAITSTVTAPTNAATIPVTVTFTEAVNGFTAGDLIVGGGSVENFRGSGDSYSFDLKPGALDGPITVDIAPNKAFDAAANGNNEAEQFSITSDRTGPTPEITSTVTGPTDLDSIPISVAFGEPVNEFTADDLTVSGGTVSNFQDAGGGQFTFDVAPTSNGTVTVDIAANAAEDAVGNPTGVAERFSIDSLRAPDLELTLLSPPATAVAGANAIYAIQITNISLNDASGIAITGTLPAALVLDRDNTSGDVILEGQNITINIEGLLAGESTLRTVTGRLLSTLAAGSSFDMTFTASSQLFVDSDLTNNSDSATTTVVRQADVSVSVTDGPDPAFIGGFTLYTLTVKNNGPANASTVIVTHTLPAGFAFDAANSDAGATVNGQAIRYTIASLASTQERVITIATTIASDAVAREVTANTTVTATETDPTQSNNAAETETRLVVPNTGSNPSARPDTVTADAGQSQSIPLETLLGNDTNVTVVSGVTDPLHGSIEFDSDANAFVYTPDANFSGLDGFQYTVEGAIDEKLVLAIMTGTGAELATSQIAILNAGWSTGNGFASSFTFGVDQSEASPAVLSALTSGELIPTVTLVSRREATVKGQNTTVETLRWTMHDVRFESYSVLQNAAEVRGSEVYAATFEQIELDVADDPNNVGRRFHVGRDFVADEAFNSNQFGPLPLALPLAKNSGKDRLGLFINDPDGNLGAAALGSIRFSVSNDAGLETDLNDVHTSAGTVSITLGGNRPDDGQAAAVFLQKSLDGSAFAKLELTRGVLIGQNIQRTESKWTLTNVKVLSFNTALSGDASTFEVNLEYERIDLVQDKLNADGSIVQNKRLFASLNLTTEDDPQINVPDNFGRNTIAAGTEEQVLHTPTGDLHIDSFEISAGAAGDDFAFQTMTFTTSGGIASPKLFASAASGILIDEMTFTEFSSPDTEGDRVPLVTWVLTDARLVSHSFETQADEGSPGITETFEVIAKILRETINDPNLPDNQDPTATFDQVEQTTEQSHVDFGDTIEPLGDSLFLRIGDEFVQIARFDWGVGRSDTVVGNTINVFAPTGTYSVGLLQAVTTRTEFPEVEIVTRRRSGPNRFEDVQTMVLSDVTFASYAQSNVRDEHPADSFVLQFGQAEVEVITIDNSGNATAPFQTGIDFATDTPLTRNVPEFPIRDVIRMENGLFLQFDDRGAELQEFSVSLQGAGSAMRSSVTLVSDSPEGNLRLLDALLTGTNFHELKLLHKRDGHVFETWKLTNAAIGSYEVSASDSGEAPVSSFSLSYDQLDITHAPRNEEGTGKPPATITATIDLIDNTATGGGDFGGVNELITAGRELVDFGDEQFQVVSGSWAASSITAGSNHQTSASEFAFTAFANAALPGLFAIVGDGRSLEEIEFSQFASGRSGQPVATTQWLLTEAKLTSVSYVVRDGGDTPQVAFTVGADRIAQTLSFLDQDGDVTTIPTADYNFDTQETESTTPFTDLERIPVSTATVSIDVRPAFVDGDGDLVDDRVEANAPNNGDGNNDGTKDNLQTNVTSLPHPVSGNFVTLGAPSGQILKSVEIETPTATPPPDLDFRVGLIGYELNNAPAASGETTITIFVNGVSGFNTYYKFGPTPDNATPHYYRFLFDSATGLGAQIFSDRIVVHLKDGRLGDDDLTVNGKIVDPGAPAVNNSALPNQNPITKLDVSDDGSVSPIDALQVINELNSVGSHALSTTLVFPIEKSSFLDVNGDNFVSPIDALQVINFLNDPTSGAEGEGPTAVDSSFADYAQATDAAMSEIVDAPAAILAPVSSSVASPSRSSHPALSTRVSPLPIRSATASAKSVADRARHAAVRDAKETTVLHDESARDDFFASLRE